MAAVQDEILVVSRISSVYNIATRERDLRIPLGGERAMPTGVVHDCDSGSNPVVNTKRDTNC